MLKRLKFQMDKIRITGSVFIGYLMRRALNFALYETAMSIRLERQRRALATTVDYVERHMCHVDSVGTKKKLIAKAFMRADISGERLICEFGVFAGNSINHIAKMTDQRVFGFDSFEGLPERWMDNLNQGAFAVPKLPKVRKNVTLVKGWFNETLPAFLRQHTSLIGFLHIDSDLYSSAKTIFELLEPRLKPGAVIVFDEYFNYPGWQEGEYKAFMEFLDKTGISFEFIGYHRNEQQVAVILQEKK
jgi:predicted O-methyltransferase YrrM